MLMMNILETRARVACFGSVVEAWKDRGRLAGVRPKSHAKAAQRLFYRKRYSPFGRFSIKELAGFSRSGQRLPNEIAPRLDGEEG